MFMRIFTLSARIKWSDQVIKHLYFQKSISFMRVFFLRPYLLSCSFITRQPRADAEPSNFMNHAASILVLVNSIAIFSLTDTRWGDQSKYYFKRDHFEHVMMELYPGYLEDHFNLHKLRCVFPLDLIPLCHLNVLPIWFLANTNILTTVQSASWSRTRCEVKRANNFGVTSTNRLAVQFALDFHYLWVAHHDVNWILDL